MSSIKSQRQRGQRREANHGGKSLLAPTLGVHTSDVGEHRLNVPQMYALDQMYVSHPAVQAARTVLHSQLLSGGVQLVRDGQPLRKVKFGEKDEAGKVKKGVTRDFQSHLDEFWLPFARDIVDCFLKWGIAPVVFEAVPDDEHTQAMATLKRELGAPSSAKRKAVDKPTTIVPHVPMIGTYDIAWAYAGRYGYSREYFLYNNAPGHVTGVDPTAMIHVRQHPDSVGNINSPLATVYEQASFVSGLVEMAFTAEISRSAPSIVTQVRKPEKGADLTAGALFFDSQSRNAQQGAEGEESQQAALNLDMQAQLCKVINSIQSGTGTGASTAAGRPAFTPPDVPPRLFVLPKDQELAPHVTMPQPRGDLEAMMRLGIDQMCSALGVPSALVFEGRFSNNSSVQLQLLNSTVTQLAKSVNRVLTSAYNSIYGDDDEEGEESAQLKLMTAPLSVAEEIERLFTAQLIDYQTALPAALHSLGATTEELENAMERAKEKNDKKCECEQEDRKLAQEYQKLNMKERTLGLNGLK